MWLGPRAGGRVGLVWWHPPCQALHRKIVLRDGGAGATMALGSCAKESQRAPTWFRGGGSILGSLHTVSSLSFDV